MANQKTESMDKAVRDEMMRLLRRGVENPTELTLSGPYGDQRDRIVKSVAAQLLKEVGFIADSTRITLAGMDYYRQETANPVLTWLRSNWFAVIVAGCTIGVSIFGIVSG